MELDQLEQSAKQLNAVLNEFPIAAVSLDDFRPIEEKVHTTRKSLIPLNARLLMLKAKYKQYVDDRRSESEDEVGNTLQNVVSDMLLNTKAVKLCLHSTTILSMLSNKEGTAEDQKKLNTYMSKLFTLNDNIMATQEAIEKASQVQLDLKIECQKAVFEHTKFLKEQEQMRSERLQKTNPEIVQTKNQLEKYIRNINIIKKLIRNFIAVSSHMLEKKPILLKMLENHRDLINIETIVKMSQSNEENE
ncbi:PREDICTED: uncharacterized protein LOC105153940 [Acromyrmex echinatior]|uniref:Uncharacterized protein n=1 Tax=Acromyrmex echinatior TaxID=103372 RepID=F4X899_ACREC|nr:PREDICTED: uncharacterized protein LOC105153940 [Acromyrmex echinatior]EGI57173.1 hypothetical protein G5I_14643 [Acromyrmex echinatior]